MEEIFIEVLRGVFAWAGETFRSYVRLGYILFIFAVCIYRFEFSDLRDFYRDKENKKYSRSRFTLFVSFLAGIIFVTLDYLNIPEGIHKKEIIKIMIVSHIAHFISFVVLKFSYDYLIKFIMSGTLFKIIFRRSLDEPVEPTQ
ncbi:MAG: hypothetical protein SH817_08660 [Leptospira sp.]|nr:hypothetical protein [Leptospira sp.]